MISEGTMMKHEMCNDMTGAAWIGWMYDNTVDGQLTLQTEDGTAVTYEMDWNAGDRDAVIARYQALAEALTRLGKEHAYLEVSTKDMPEALKQVWDTYILPYPDHGMDHEHLADIDMRVEMGEEVTEEEAEMLWKAEHWLREQALTRLPFNRCEPAALIQRARRYEKLVSLHAPKVVIDHEARCLAEQMVLYDCRKAMDYTCRCCGRVYDLFLCDGYSFGSICPSCGWEEDGSEEAEYSSANQTTMLEYRKGKTIG